MQVRAVAAQTRRLVANADVTVGVLDEAAKQSARFGPDAVESRTVVEEHGIVWNARGSAEHDSTRDLARHVYWRCQFESVHARGVGKKRYFRLNLSSLSVLRASLAIVVFRTFRCTL
eukprot:scaffold15171_cov51-Phaeocystis_antarctica.AAC.2